MKLIRTTDAIALICVCVCLTVAFFYQLVFGELPCALCNLQRVAFMIFGGGLLLNLRFGISPWNHVLSAAGALIGSLVALLQMFVHVMPGTPPTGSAFLGLHMYAWSYVMLTGAVVYALLSIAIYASSRERDAAAPGRQPVGQTTWLSAVFVFLVSANLVSAFLENGFHPFKAGGQQHYQMLYDGDVMKP
jgi:disulfide bond formation protein DsbB